MANKNKSVTMEEINENWNDWWDSLTDSQKKKLVEEQLKLTLLASRAVQLNMELMLTTTTQK